MNAITPASSDDTDTPASSAAAGSGPDSHAESAELRTLARVLFGSRATTAKETQ